MLFQRKYYDVLKKRIEQKRSFIQVIMGPRQVGKTTLITQFLNEYAFPHHFISADAVPVSDFTWIEQQWEIARLRYKNLDAPEFLLVIDEIQKISNWSEIIKKLWDYDTRNDYKIKVVLLGSSRLLLQQGLTESLTGRFETIYAGHWTYPEMSEAFGWTANEFAWFGGYPGSAVLRSDEQRWKEYINNSLIETTISKDILQLTRVDKPSLLKQLFEFGCLYSGQVLSFNKMLGQLHDVGNTTTLSHYLYLLDTAGLLGGLEKFSGTVIRQKGSSPKLQVHNTALISAQRPEFFEEILVKPADWGRVVESAIGAYLINVSRSNGLKVFYWRHRNDEIDFVLVWKNKIIGLEIKSGAVQSLSGMAAFKEEFKPDKTYLIGKDGLPWEEFLTINPVELF